MGCLYKVTSPSGKSYIGITLKSFDERWAEHCKPMAGRSRALHSAIKKYGSASFNKQTLVIANDWQYLCALESNAIHVYGTLGPHGYNMTTGGDGVIGMSDEAKEKHRKNTSDGTYAAWQRDDFRVARAAALARPEVKERHRQATAEGTRLAYADGRLRKKLQEQRSKPEFRAAMSEKVKKLWQDPEYRANQVDKRSARPKRTEESKKRQSEKMRALIAVRKEKGTYWL